MTNGDSRLGLFASDSELIAQARGLADGSIPPQRRRWTSFDHLTMLADALERELEANARLREEIRVIRAKRNRVVEV